MEESTLNLANPIYRLSQIIIVLLILMSTGCTASSQSPPAETILTRQVTVEVPVEVTREVVITATSATSDPSCEGYTCADPTGQRVMFWHNHLFEREFALLQMVNTFNISNPWEITVTARFIGGADDVFDETGEAIASDSARPDLVVAFPNHAAFYASSDSVIDLNPLLTDSVWGLAEATLADIPPGLLAADVSADFDGQRLGMPQGRSMEVLYVNTDWLNELRSAGRVGFSGLPDTPDQFKEAVCAAVQQPFSRSQGGLPTGYAINVDASRLASWTFAFGGDIYSAESGLYTYDSPEAVEAMSFLQGLIQDGCARIETRRFGDQDAFGDGTALFAIGTSAGLPFYDGAVSRGAGHQWTVAALPHTGDVPVQNVYGPSISILRSQPEREVAAWLFLAYLLETDNQVKWAEASEYFPVRLEAAAGLTAFYADTPQFQAGFELLPYGRSEPGLVGYEGVRDLATRMMGRILRGEIDPLGGLAELNRQANATLE
jgi:ABC-type glycerol-3-phosphate transport system substrate-binding protein